MFAGLTVLYAVMFALGCLALESIFPPTNHWLHVAKVRSALFVFNLAVYCGLAVFVAGIKSFAEFKSVFDLTKPRAMEVLAALAIGAALQFGGIILFSGGLSHLHAAHSLEFKKLPAVFAPFMEEPAMRGFAYKAFRNSYGVAASVGFVVVISWISHPEVCGSSYRFVMISAVNAALCLIKERRASLWNCIACHFAFNAVYVGIDQG